MRRLREASEVQLDVFAAGTLKLGLILCLLAVFVVACIAVAACGTDEPDLPA